MQRHRSLGPGFFTSAELAKVLAALHTDLAPAIEFASITGFRLGEVRSLTWARMDLGHSILRLEPGTTKNDEGRTWPFDLHPRLGALIREQWRRTEALQRQRGKIVSWVFWREEGNQIGSSARR